VSWWETLVTLQASCSDHFCDGGLTGRWPGRYPKTGTPPWCCPRQIWFWRPDCAAGARRFRAVDRVANPAVIHPDDAWRSRRRAASPRTEASDASGETPRRTRSHPGAGPFFSRSGHAAAQSRKSKSLSENCEGCRGKGFWLGPRRRGRSSPAAGCDGRANAGPSQKTGRPEGFHAQGRMASLLLSRRPTRSILPRRASPCSLGRENGAPCNFQTGSEGPGALAPGPGMDKQRTDTVAGRYRCGHRHFAVDVSVFWAHLLRSPSSVKTGKFRDGTGAILGWADRRLIRRQHSGSFAV